MEYSNNLDYSFIEDDTSRDLLGALCIAPEEFNVVKNYLENQTNLPLLDMSDLDDVEKPSICNQECFSKIL